MLTLILFDIKYNLDQVEDDESLDWLIGLDLTIYDFSQLWPLNFNSFGIKSFQFQFQVFTDTSGMCISYGASLESNGVFVRLQFKITF
jgi:hypothetical protein